MVPVPKPKSPRGVHPVDLPYDYDMSLLGISLYPKLH